MKVEKNVSLKKLNTFRVDVYTDILLAIDSDNDFSNIEVTGYLKNDNLLILGGGSNILFTKDFKGCVTLIRNMGKAILEESDQSLTVQVSAGENWDDFVKWSVKKNLIGLHNLALIPGTVGATPIQNVGAYGVEIKDFLTEVEIIDIQKGRTEIIKNSECKFGYRDSIFKNELKDKVIIKSVTFKLPKYAGKFDDKYTQYAGIKDELKEKEPTPKNIYDSVVRLRESKLPKIEEFGSCGSTFKNPEISISEYDRLLKTFPELPKYDTDKKGIVKIPAAYILEKLGWKNKRKGDVGTWIYHPLIVTNYGNATGQEILSFINEIKSDFKSNTNLDLECEINII